MNFGCAIIASDQVGCVLDLVEGKSGLVVPWDDDAVLEEALQKIARDPAKLNECQATARSVISNWDVGAYVKGMHKALAITENS